MRMENRMTKREIRIRWRMGMRMTMNMEISMKNTIKMKPMFHINRKITGKKILKFNL